MKVSMVVATLSRPEHIKVLLESLSNNTRLPEEVVIVEQGDMSALEAVTQDYVEKFPIRLIFEAQKSLAVARDRGQKESAGDVLIFCDDDIEFNQSYIETVVTYLFSNESVLGMTGSYMHHAPAWTLKRFIGVLFGVYSWEQRNMVLPSGCYDYVRGSKLLEEQVAEWLYGCNMVLRSKVFDMGFGFNTNFTRWSFGEDVLATYPIHKRFPGSLRYHPGLKVKHNEGTTRKMLNLQATRMKVIYRYIFWHREVYQGRYLRLLSYLWSQVGLSGLELLQYPSFATVQTLVDSYMYVFRYHRKIAAEQIDYNAFILQE